jgi:hypothetical protein
MEGLGVMAPGFSRASRLKPYSSIGSKRVREFPSKPMKESAIGLPRCSAAANLTRTTRGFRRKTRIFCNSWIASRSPLTRGAGTRKTLLQSRFWLELTSAANATGVDCRPCTMRNGIYSDHRNQVGKSAVSATPPMVGSWKQIPSARGDLPIASNGHPRQCDWRRVHSCGH